MSIERHSGFIPSLDDEGEYFQPESEFEDTMAEEPASLIPEWHESTRHWQSLDLGPSDFRFDRDLGPDSDEDEAVFADAADPKYIETQLSNGVHCMDDRNFEPGIQLPGGIIETRLAGRYLDSERPERPVSEVYAEVVNELREEGWRIWVHGDKCAASFFKREALALADYYSSAASDFQDEVMNALGLDYDKEDFSHILATGAARAKNRLLWNTSGETALRVNSARRMVQREDFHESHRPAGLRIDATGNLFNNARFRNDHDGVGLLSVTAGAYRDLLFARGIPEEQVAREITYLNIFTFGIAKAVGHQYLLAGIVKD